MTTSTINHTLNQHETALLMVLVDSKIKAITENYNDPLSNKIGSLEIIAIQLESHLNSF